MGSDGSLGKERSLEMTEPEGSRELTEPVLKLSVDLGADLEARSYIA
jgi:hypothetical protein